MTSSGMIGKVGKRRNPIVIWILLPFVTLGIYSLIWYYKINRETRDLGVEANPGVSLLAISLGALILIPPFVSMFNTGGRIAQAQRSAGLAPTCSPVVGLLLWIFLFGSGTLYYQAELNKIWDHFGNLPEGSTVPIASSQQQAISDQAQGNLPAGDQQQPGYDAQKHLSQTQEPGDSQRGYDQE